MRHVMKVKIPLILALAVTCRASAVTHYVSANGGTPTSPYTSWATAAATIQDAVDVSTDGDIVLVTNGVYETGGRFVPPQSQTNRVAVDKPITVTSVNGAAATVIRGFQVPGTILGVNAIRGVYLTNGATLNGFTVTNCATSAGGQFEDIVGGGIFCVSTNAHVANCVIVGNYAGNNGGGVFGGTLTQCTITKNGGGNGGGVSSANVADCTISTNTAVDGAGAAGCNLVRCVVSLNSASENGGGVTVCTAERCDIINNFAGDTGGGAMASTISVSAVSGNRARTGGGASSSTLIGCAMSANGANTGGATFSGSVTDCTIIGNSADSGGGVFGGTIVNSIVYFNSAREFPNHNLEAEPSGTMDFCCTTPLPNAGIGNITSPPQLATKSHLTATSPCRGAGSFTNTIGVDIDGQAWLNPASIGCDEFNTNAAGSLLVSIQIAETNLAVGYIEPFSADVAGECTATRWDYGDGTVVSNQPFASHSWSLPGDYALVLSAYNQSFPSGVSATQIVHVIEGKYYVDKNSANPVPPYSSWNTAASNIQDAVDVAVIGGVVVVTNGVYNVGGRPVAPFSTTNRLIIFKPLTVLSVNGPDTTSIEGQPGTTFPWKDAVRCVYLTNGAVLSGFTITNGASQLANDQAYEEQVAGGVWCPFPSGIISNCVIRNCQAGYDSAGARQAILYNSTLRDNYANYGGGAGYSMLWDCTITNNSSVYAGVGAGGGVYFSTLNNCTLAGNSADAGGAAQDSTLTNCVVLNNSAPVGGGANSCTLVSSFISGNSAQIGGGANVGVLISCILSNNIGGLGGGGGGGANGATLDACLLINNYGGGAGGGARESTLNNCRIVGNGVSTDGGGAIRCTLNNCVVALNSSSESGGGISQSTANNCTIVGNNNGGALSSSVNNSIIYFNSGANGSDSSTFNNCCLTPLPNGGFDNFTNDPAFLDFDAGNYHLATNSPCINSGRNIYALTNVDLDNNPRIVGGTVDSGAYEFQSPTSVISYAWLLQNGFPLNGSADFLDPDSDSMNNWQEWIAGTIPADASSLLKLVHPTNVPSGIAVTWLSVSNRSYTLERGTNFQEHPALQTIAADIAGQSGTTTYIDAIATDPVPYFYRIRVQQ